MTRPMLYPVMLNPVNGNPCPLNMFDIQTDLMPLAGNIGIFSDAVGTWTAIIPGTPGSRINGALVSNTTSLTGEYQIAGNIGAFGSTVLGFNRNDIIFLDTWDKINNFFFRSRSGAFSVSVQYFYTPV
ncbi:MAG: hypothetical protein ABL951_04205 [Alphaproteobacteria bacterium]